MEIQVNLPPGLIGRAAQQIGIDLDGSAVAELEEVVTTKNEENRLKQK